MYGKHFTTMYTGSMYGAGAVVFAVWGYVIAHTVQSQVELNPLVIGAALGVSPDEVERAIGFLCSPDPKSRNQDHEGKRLVHEDAFTYFVPSHAKYRAIRSEDDRRAYNREAQRRHRAKSRDVNTHVNDSQSLSTMSAHTEAEAETKAKTTSARKRPRADGATFSLAPYIDAHREFFPGADPPAARYGRVFKALEAKHGHLETLRRFKNCLTAKGTFASPEHLAQFWSEYDSAPEPKAPPRFNPNDPLAGLEERVAAMQAAQDKQIAEDRAWLARRR